MARLHFFEFHDLEWFPAVWRDLLTDFLSYFFRTFKPYVGVAPILAEALRMTATAEIVDLCSGAGQPVVSVLPALGHEDRVPSSVILTDKFPNLEAFHWTVAAGGGRVTCEERPVDAMDVPGRLTGFRTLFTSFHHFKPEEAHLILADARAKRTGIGVFEFTERNWLLWTIPVLMIPVLNWMCTPFIRPFRWRRLLWTYLIPVVPLVAMWDGFVSNLRSYSIRELEALIGDLEGPDYTWRIGRVPSLGLSRVTYLVGWPAGGAGSPGSSSES